MNLGSRVDLYYFGESNTVRTLSGTISDANASWVIVRDAHDKTHAFPLTSIQRMILLSE